MVYESTLEELEVLLGPRRQGSIKLVSLQPFTVFLPSSEVEIQVLAFTLKLEVPRENHYIGIHSVVEAWRTKHHSCLIRLCKVITSFSSTLLTSEITT